MLTLVAGLIASLIGTLATAVVQVVTAFRVTAVKQATDLNASTLLVVAKDTEAIKGHVNSEKTAAEGKLNTAMRENELLREMLADRKATAALLAQAVAVSGAVGGALTVVPAPAVVVATPPAIPSQGAPTT
jgi:hypothetical protein